MTTFVRDDGLPLRVVAGFRDRVLAYRPSVTPRPHWTPEQYARAAEKKLDRARRLIAEIGKRYDRLDGADVLDVGCGDGINCLVLASAAGRAVGVDLRLPLFEPDETGGQARRLSRLVLERLDAASRLAALPRLPARFARADATRLAFPDDTFDVLLSRSAMEHVAPVELALAEMARVVRPGGVIHHSVDPYFWLRGCHKRGLVDIPWAHARLSLEDFDRFVTEREGAAVAAQRRGRLQTLNRLTLAEWRAPVAAGPFGILGGGGEPAPLSAQPLGENSDLCG